MSDAATTPGATSALSTLITAGAGLVGGGLGAWIAASLALRHYFSQRIWDRRADAYTTVFEALDGMSDWYALKIEELRMGVTPPNAIEEKQINEYRDHRKKLSANLASAVWLLPASVAERVRQMESAMARSPSGDWNTFVFDGNDAINAAIEDIAKLARKTLHVPDDGLRGLPATIRSVVQNLRLRGTPSPHTTDRSR